MSNDMYKLITKYTIHTDGGIGLYLESLPYGIFYICSEKSGFITVRASSGIHLTQLIKNILKEVSNG